MAIPDYTDPRFRLAAGSSWHPGGLELTKRGLELCRFPEGAHVLDIGCGRGETLKLMQGLKLNAVGLDKNRYAPDGLPVIEGDASAPPFAEGSLDGIVCECVLSLLPSPEKALASFRRILKPGGLLLLSDLYLPDDPGRGLTTRQAPSSCFEGAPGKKALERILAGSGFEIIHFEDHPEALKDLAAKLIWYGGISLKDACFASGCSSRPGYGLWIGERKETPFPGPTERRCHAIR